MEPCKIIAIMTRDTVSAKRATKASFTCNGKLSIDRYLSQVPAKERLPS